MPELMTLYVEAMDDELEKLKTELIEMREKAKCKGILSFLSFFFYFLICSQENNSTEDSNEESKNSLDTHSHIFQSWWFCSPDWPAECNHEIEDGSKLVSLNNWEQEPLSVGVRRIVSFIILNKISYRIQSCKSL